MNDHVVEDGSGTSRRQPLPSKLVARMRRMVIGAMACGAVAAAVGVAGGAANAAGSVPAPCHNGKHSSMGATIGLSFAQEQALFSQLQNDIEHFAKLMGCNWNFKVTNGNGDPSQQITNVQQLIAQGVNLVWVNQAQAQGWNPVVAQAKKDHVIFYNWSSVTPTGSNLNATVDQAAMGEIVAAPAAAWSKKHFGGKAKIGVLVSTSDPGFQARAKAFEAKMKKLDPQAQFIATGNGGFTNPQAAEQSTLSMIQAHSDLNMVFADWDGAVLGAAQAAQQAGKTDPHSFYIAGQDGSVEQLQMMSRPGSILQSTGAELWRYEAGVVVANMQRLLLHEYVPPTRLLVPTLVTTSNVKAITKEENNPFTPANKALFNNIEFYFKTPMVLNQPDPAGHGIKYLNTPYTPLVWIK
jgi:ABC-type sugar transport system substrate-binding protein